MYKSGQTPDDVYYSPGRDGLAVKENEQVRYDEYINSEDDQYLRMKVANRSRWNSLDDFDYWYDSRYDFGQRYYSYGGYNSWNNLYAWNPYYYSLNPAWNYGLSYGYGMWRPGYGIGWSYPVYTVIGYANPKSYYGGAVFTGSTSGSNISAFKNRSYNNTNSGYRDSKTGQWVNDGSQNNFGNLMKRVFNPSSNNSNNYNNSWDRPVRTFNSGSNSNTYNNSSNSSSSSSGTSSSAGGNSGGYKSTGSNTSGGRTRGN
jgi:hypothetical protein